MCMCTCMIVFESASSYAKTESIVTSGDSNASIKLYMINSVSLNTILFCVITKNKISRPELDLSPEKEHKFCKVDALYCMKSQYINGRFAKYMIGR